MGKTTPEQLIQSLKGWYETDMKQPIYVSIYDSGDIENRIEMFDDESDEAYETKLKECAEVAFDNLGEYDSIWQAYSEALDDEVREWLVVKLQEEKENEAEANLWK